MCSADIAQTVVAEEGGFGKVPLWDGGAYKEMDVCLMYDVVETKSDLFTDHSMT